MNSLPDRHLAMNDAPLLAGASPHGGVERPAVQESDAAIHVLSEAAHADR
jgi:hypothetical protein